MRRRDLAILALALVALTTTGCGSGSRNTKAGRVKSVEQVAPRYDLHDDAATRQRLAQQEKLGLALNRLQSGDYADAEKQARGVLRKDSRSVDAHTVLAAVLGARGDVAGAG
ncbi:type IV pilus biogenesis/stability protein PilW, partial [Xanthomonas sp. Kuri4-2]